MIVNWNWKGISLAPTKYKQESNTNMDDEDHLADTRMHYMSRLRWMATQWQTIWDPINKINENIRTEEEELYTKLMQTSREV